MWWMNIIVVALLALGIFGFVSLVRLLTRRMTSETTRRTEDMYDQYADSPHKRHRRSLASRRYCPVLPNRVPNSPLRFAARSWGLATLRAEGGHLEGNGPAFPAPLLRHAAFHSGASVKRVQLALGHATPTITLNTYVGE
jgi:hypothetical protein